MSAASPELPKGTGNQFFDHPVLNSPYTVPTRHWELDRHGQPTQQVVDTRRRAEFISPIPRPKKHKKVATADLAFADPTGLSSEQQKQQYAIASTIEEIRQHVAVWRALPQSQWLVTPETARLLAHWRSDAFTGPRPFFCQVEAIETVIWLTEVAPKEKTKSVRALLERLERASEEANPGLQRLALKLATGAGKTTVMAMLIGWQTINAARRPGSEHFTNGFLVCAPGITIRDRLRVLQPNDPESYFRTRQIVPADMLREMQGAKIVITNFHAFRLREKAEISAGGRALLRGRRGEVLDTREAEGDMLRRVMNELTGMSGKGGGILVLNDEAHHCYREKPLEEDEEDDEWKGDEKKEAQKNNEAARMWISGLEIAAKRIGVKRVIDLSATPFFLRGSGYAEGTLFPWTMCDFSLMDAIESGIVKLPRVPVAENISGDEMPMFRNLWEHVRKDMPKKGRGQGAELDPLMLPARLQTALEALYGHYAKTFALWQERKIPVPPCFIIVCQNTAISKLVYDYVSGFYKKNKDDTSTLVNGRLAHFRNFDEGTGNPLARPNTLLIDSEQLEAGDALDEGFRAMAKDEIERFRREVVERTGDQRAGDAITDQDLLREVMNTVGKPGQLGGQIRCVVSVAMLTEGWDANTVTHILGIRAFGTQLLCEQVIGRALRRQSYEVNTTGLFDVEYADIFGIPFDFTAKPVVAPPQPPRETVQVKAVSPERDALEIRFPRVVGYRIDMPEERLEAKFNDDSILELTPALVGPSVTQNQGIVGAPANMSLEHLAERRYTSILYDLTKHLIGRWKDVNEDLPYHLFGQLKRIAKEWVDTRLVCKGGTHPALLYYRQLADMACDRIIAAINRRHLEERPVKALLDPFQPTGSTRAVRFNTSRLERWQARPDRSHVNWVILDSGWEAELCRVVEEDPRVLAYVKNHGLGFEVPYRSGSDVRRYRPDFIVLVDDGRGGADPLHLVVEIKGFRGEDAKDKAATMDTYWVPGVNHLGTCGRWAFAEFKAIYEIEAEFKKAIERQFEAIVEKAAAQPSGKS